MFGRQAERDWRVIHWEAPPEAKAKNISSLQDAAIAVHCCEASLGSTTLGDASGIGSVLWLIQGDTAISVFFGRQNGKAFGHCHP